MMTVSLCAVRRQVWGVDCLLAPAAYGAMSAADCAESSEVVEQGAVGGRQFMSERKA